MAVAWRTRCTRLLDLLPDVQSALRCDISPEDRQFSQIVACLNSDHPGQLLDLLEYHVNQEARVAGHQTKRLCHQIAELQLKYKRDFTVVHTLAEQPSVGSSVTVVKARGLGASKKVYAVKTISKSSALKLEGQTSIVHERDILIAASQDIGNHAPQIIAATQDATHLHLILEYLPAGDLGLLLAERKVLPIKWVRLWIAQTAQAIIWLHGLGYAHRDIKPANILLELSGHCKLADYGSAAPLSKEGSGLFVSKRYCLSPVGTVDYIAPDILLAHEKAILDSDEWDEDEDDLDPPGLYDASVDFWSLGVSMFEMLLGKLPFYAETIPETYENILQYEVCLDFCSLRIDTSAKDLMKQLITRSQSRIQSHAIQKHPFFAEIIWDDVRKTTPAFRPPIRCLEPRTGQASHEEFSRGFDFSALFSSPGLSILRNAGPDEADLRWLGFTFLPEKGYFDMLDGEITEDQLLPGFQHNQAPVTAYPTTPARSSATYNAKGSGMRSRENIRALQEVATYTILRTARKASAGPRKVPPHIDEFIPPIRSRFSQLERRHEKLLASISNIESRYKNLLQDHGGH